MCYTNTYKFLLSSSIRFHLFAVTSCFYFFSKNIVQDLIELMESCVPNLFAVEGAYLFIWYKLHWCLEIFFTGKKLIHLWHLSPFRARLFPRISSDPTQLWKWWCNKVRIRRVHAMSCWKRWGGDQETPVLEIFDGMAAYWGI